MNKNIYHYIMNFISYLMIFGMGFLLHKEWNLGGLIITLGFIHIFSYVRGGRDE